MSGNKIFLDTNIILYLLNGDEVLASFLNQKQIYISFVTELELLSFPNLSKSEENVIIDFLSHCKIISLNQEIKTEVIRIRKSYRKKLPDSLIMASAIYLDMPMITADGGFKGVEELNLVHYER